MAGILPGAVAGFEAADAAHARAAMVDLENRRVDLEQKRQDAELGRQKNLDSLNVLNEQATTLANQARPHLAYMNTPPVDPKADPEGYQKWLDSDEYKQHDEQAADLDKQVGTLRDKKKSIQDQIIGTHVQQTKDQVAQNTAAVLSGAKSIHDLPPEDVTDMFSTKAQIPPHAFLRDPKTGRAPIDDLNDAVHDGITTGNWNDKGDVIAAMVPSLHAAVGHPMAGGTVTGVTVGRVHMNPDDKQHLHFTPVYQVHLDDGSTKTVKGPDDATLPVTLDQLGKRATNLQQLGELSKHPDLQAKIQQSFQDRTTSFHKLNDDLLSAGVPQNELLPAPYKWEKAGAISVAINPSTGLPATGADGKPIQIGQQRTPAKLQEIQARMASTGEDFETAEQNVDLGNKGFSDFRNPNVRPAPADGGAATNALNDQRLQRAADLAHRGAVLQLAREKGYVVDKEGNVKYSVDTADHKKGEAVNDVDFDAAVSNMRQVADEGAQGGKRVTASSLVTAGKAAAKKAASTPAPLPKTKAEMVKDHVYATPRGAATWDGEKFIPVKK